MPTIAEQRARIAELASRMIANNPGNAGNIMQKLRDAGLDISGNPIGAPAPAAQAGGFPLPRVPPAGGLSYTGLMTGADLGPLAKYAGRTPAAPPTGLSPDETALPFNGTGGDPAGLAAMANRNDPSQTPDFRSRMYDARAGLGSARVPPGSGLAIADPSMANVGVNLPSNFMLDSPRFGGNLPRTRPPEQLSAAGPPSPLTGAGPPSPLAQAGGPSPLPGVGPPAPIIGREAPPSLNGPPSPLASRFGDQSQLPGGAFSGSLPRPPQPRPFESMIAARPAPGGPGGLPAAPLLGGQPFTGSPGMASRFGDQSQLASGAFSGAPPPPIARGPTPPQIDAAKDMVRQMASLPQVAPPKSLMPIEMTPTSTMPDPMQRTPLDLAAGIGAPKLPLGSTNMPFAAIPPTPASVAQRTDILGPLPPGAGTGVSAVPAQTPLGTSRGLPTAPEGPAPVPPPTPPVGIPSMLASVGPPKPARMEVMANYTGADTPFPGAPPAPPPASQPNMLQRAARSGRNLIAGDNKQPVAPVAPVNEQAPPPEQRPPIFNAPNIGTVAGGVAGLMFGGAGGAVAGASGGRLLGKLVSALRSGRATVDANGNIVDKAGKILGNVGGGLKTMFGQSNPGGSMGLGGSRSGGGGMGMGGSYGGGFGGGGGYSGGGTYGGSGGAGINQGIGGAYRNR